MFDRGKRVFSQRTVAVNWAGEPMNLTMPWYDTSTAEVLPVDASQLEYSARSNAILKRVREAVLPIALAVNLYTGVAHAASLPSHPMLTLEAARTVVAAARAKAKAEGWPCVISVVDSDGLAIILERMDDAVLAGVELAPGKARTAALFRRETSALEEAINGRRPAIATARGFVLMRGGVPIVVDNQIVGAIGVSADTPDHDEVIAIAGIAALSE
jgi:glc operon protein GlcG